MANVTLYINNSDNRLVNKNIGSELSFKCDLTEITSVENPVIRLDNANVSLLRYNYCHIDTFDRYYYCKVSIEGTTAIIECNVDVLMSFKNQILSNTYLIKRNEFLKDDRLIDSEIPISCKKQIVTQAVSDDFMQRGISCFILGVI